MKRILSVAFLFIALGAFSQGAESIKATNDSINNAPKKNYAKRIYKVAKDRIVLDLNGTNWIHNVPGLKTKWYSRGFNFYIMYDFQIKKSFFSIAPGLGVSQTNVYHRSLMTDSASTGIKFTPLTNPDNYKTNKLTMTYLKFRWNFVSAPSRISWIICGSLWLASKPEFAWTATPNTRLKTPNKRLFKNRTRI